MEEELFTSGRNIPNIDPSLQIWHWPISVYLFLGGLAAGLLFFAALSTVLKKEDETPATVKYAIIVAPIALVLGLMALFYDLTHKIFFWQLYTTVRIESPMSWGAWVLLFITPLSMLWVFSYWKDIFPKMDLRLSFLEKFRLFLAKNRMKMAYVLIPLSIILGIYTGILLSAFNARPLWNNAILGPLFLVSGLSTAAATIILFSKSHSERSLFSKIDVGLIIIELALIVHMIMGYWAGSEVQLEAMELLVNGEFTVMFFVFVIILGLLLPGLLEIMELRGYKVPVVVPAILILIGGLVFRFVMVEAGQLTRYLY
ncbi:NrfD/PsrC family molybdoenzyme membrane anchor subunit [Maribacter sp. TH_r10]|uniref:Nitrite reductase n=1 Tax=Maribacter luteus TaxID=2594478 RepID=A0A6I2MJS7_9FLAO|nr:MULTISPECIES: NrfD/PsrC family molybdoenzyme membrane anchor subunit [Maribacter]MDV7138813.1 NrfD/PsrC family molybdoenzyme membrane anchor subunit [Maribacter sp. TH_r10]MRX64023.1 nitrite reductase [Maribacter luteus]